MSDEFAPQAWELVFATEHQGKSTKTTMISQKCERWFCATYDEVILTDSSSATEAGHARRKAQKKPDGQLLFAEGMWLIDEVQAGRKAQPVPPFSPDGTGESEPQKERRNRPRTRVLH